MTGRTKQEIITKDFFPESAYSSPNRRRSPKKSPRRKLRQKAEAIVEGTSENVEEEHEGKATSPKSAMSNDRRATNNDVGFTAGAAAVALSVNDIISTSAATAATAAASTERVGLCFHCYRAFLEGFSNRVLQQRKDSI